MIFIADDHPIVGIGLSKILQNAPGKNFAGQAYSPDQLFQALPSIKPDLLLLDLNMPGNDFYRTISCLKRDYPQLRILVFTAYQSQDLPASLLDCGANGFMVKTATPGEILHAIDEVMEGRTYCKVPICRNSASSDLLPPPSALPDDYRRGMPLSKREQEILVLISKGFTSLRIAKTLFISKHTVETHRKNILRKLELNSSTELVKFALQQGLLVE